MAVVDVVLDHVSVNHCMHRANMADHSVGAQDKLHESEASCASVFCIDIASPLRVLLCRRSGLVAFRSTKSRRHSEVKHTRPSTKEEFSGKALSKQDIEAH